MHGDLFPLSLEQHKGQATTGMIGEKAGAFEATRLIEKKVCQVSKMIDYIDFNPNL